MRSIIDATRLHSRLVLATVIATVALVAIYQAVFPPIYEAEATIMGERDVDLSRDSFYTGWNVFRKDDQRTELELMISGPVLAEVAIKLKLGYDDVYHPFFSHLSWIWESSWLGRNYREAKEWVFPPEPGAPKASDLMLGRTVVDMRAGISLTPVHEAIVGRLSVRGPNRRVAEIANAIVDVYAQQRTARYAKEAQTALDVLNPEVERAAKELHAIEARRVAFAAEHGLTFDLQRENQEVKALTEMDQNLSTARVKIASLEAGLVELTRQLASEPKSKRAATVYELDGVRESLRAKRLDLQTTLIALRNRYREDSPEVVEQVANLAKLDALLASGPEKIEKATTDTLNSMQQNMEATANGLRAELASARASVSRMEQATATLRARLTTVPDLQAQLRNFDRELLLANDKYTQLATKRSQATVSAVTTKAAIPSIRIVEYASPPSEKSWPKPRLLYPAALIVGLLLGAAAAQIRRFAAGRVRRGFWGRRGGDALVYGVVGAAPDWSPLAVRLTARGDAGKGSI